jgi:hypothetical protein
MEPSAEFHDVRLTPSLRALLTEIVDYAGLFPPARLPLREALHNYVTYRQEPEAWMLGRFVVPLARLGDLDDYAPLFKHEPPTRFSVLGSGGDDAATFAEAFEDDLDALTAFERRHHDRVLADVMEVRLPAELLGTETRNVQTFLHEVDRRIVRAGTPKLDVFYEVPVDADLPDTLPPVLAALAEHNSLQAVPARSIAGLKLRCGGLEPSDHPDPAYVAFAVAACRDTGVRFKATAGLHHPGRHYNDDAEAHMHGFLNLFGAAALAAEHDLGADAVEAILRDENADSFRFTPDTFAWRDLEVPTDDVAYVREHLAVSFGSCSFEEPVDDLRDLDLL